MNFDHTLATQIYMNMDKSSDGDITEEEFIRWWEKCEFTLHDRIRNKEKEIAFGERALTENVLNKLNLVIT